MSVSPLNPEQRQPKPATEHTIAANRSVLETLPFSDTRSFENAIRGFIATLEPLRITRADGKPTFDLSGFDFLQGEAPDSVNPSMWRQAQLNTLYNGLFEISDGLYQVRAFDIANMTLIRGDEGWVIVDPLTSAESSAAALKLANEHLGERPVTGVIITHSHVDHFGGILGVVSPEDVSSGRVAVIAPEHFIDESLSENVLAGNAMNRRATYMYGNLLPPGPEGFVTTGLGAPVSMGSTGIVVPNDSVRQTGETRTVDGIEIEFQMCPGTEAPAEFVFYLPQFKALCMAEITSHHLHNVYTPRGAQVRDALGWASQINESIERFGDRLDIQFASHHWPIWGREDAVQYLSKQRDLYKFIHDQTLRLANKGYTKEEIAERVALPDSLGMEFYNRDYYGTVHHNTRAVFVKYLGYFDGNPATLFAHPPSAVGGRYVAVMGGADAVVAIAREAFDQGDYRWSAELLNHIMASEPQHIAARALLADSLEQLGYQAESGPWRNFFLCGALELREGTPETGSMFTASEGVAQGMPLENLFQMLAVRVIPEKVDGLTLRINISLEDAGNWLLVLENCVLHGFPGRRSESADATITSNALPFKRLMLGLAEADELIADDQLQISGARSAIDQLLEFLDAFPRRFPIVTPRPAQGY